MVTGSDSRGGRSRCADVGGAAKGAVIGTILGVGEVTTVTAGTLSDTVRAAIKGTREVGGDVAEAGRGAAEGAISTTKSLTLSLEDAASSVAVGAIRGANDVGSELTIRRPNR